MNDVRRHYDELLGSVYSWILGDFEPASARQAALFDRLALDPFDTGVAVDLGAGPGCQSVPLARRGFEVVAIDFCGELLDELRVHAGELPIRAVQADIRDFRHHSGPADVIVCMGDTLVHLPDRDAAERVLADAAAALVPGGSLVVSIRDYERPGPTGPDRFIPIRSSESRIFTCFLDYESEYVQVHDILQERRDGRWTLEVSAYRKLRLRMDWVAGLLEAHGMSTVARVDDGGILVLHARR